MTIIRVALAEADRHRYGGDDGPLPAELVLDTEALKDLEAGELDEIERQTDMAFASLMPLLEPRLGKASFVRRAVAYLAVRQAGQRPVWDDFQPKLLRATFVQEDAGDPPAGPSEASSEA